MSQEIRTRTRSVPQIRVRTRLRPVEVVNSFIQAGVAVELMRRHFGDPSKLLWDILSQHKTMPGLKMGDRMIHADTEAEARERFENNNPEYRVLTITPMENYIVEA